jgi:hypothetical protein
MKPLEQPKRPEPSESFQGTDDWAQIQSDQEFREKEAEFRKRLRGETK